MQTIDNQCYDRDCNWHVVSTKPRVEKIAIANLANQGFDTFLPMHRKSLKRRNRVIPTLEPLFPGYIFVAFDHTQNRWQAINSTYGVRRLLTNGTGRPGPLDRRVMRDLLRRCPEGIWDTQREFLQRGDPVQVTNGAFAGLPARFAEMVPGDRVRVLLNLLSSEVSVVMPIAHVDPAS